MTDTNYAYAEAHVDELTPNQRRVLDLIVVGRTNGEIGEALGMTLDGAKWNVSEVLSKLGFTSREEAAAFWRWHRSPRRRLGRNTRALFGVPAVKWATTAAGAVVVIGAVLLIFSPGTGTQATPDGWFYLEADITTSFRDDDNAQGPGQQTMELKWWMQDERRGRWEMSELVGLADGDTSWVYGLDGRVLDQSPLPPDGDISFSPSTAISFGPLRYQSVAELTDALQEAFADDVNILGVDQILGRDVTIVEARPAGALDLERPPSTRGAPREGGFVRYWVDEERMFVMRYEVSNGWQDIVAVATRLDYPADIDDSILQLDLDLDVTPTADIPRRPSSRQPDTLYCAGDNDPDPDFGEPLTGMQRVGPVVMHMLPVVDLPPQADPADRAQIRFPITIDASSVDAGESVARVRAIPQPGEPHLQFLSESSDSAGEHVPERDLEVEAPASNAPATLSVPAILDEPGCYRFELEYAGQTYGPFGLEVPIP